MVGSEHIAILQLDDPQSTDEEVPSNHEDDHPPQQSLSIIYYITVQPLFPHAQVEESDDISVNVPSKDDMVVRVHKFEKDGESEESSTDCIVVYQLWGATVSKHVELVVAPGATRMRSAAHTSLRLDRHCTNRHCCSAVHGHASATI